MWELFWLGVCVGTGGSRGFFCSLGHRRICNVASKLQEPGEIPAMGWTHAVPDASRARLLDCSLASSPSTSLTAKMVNFLKDPG